MQQQVDEADTADAASRAAVAASLNSITVNAPPLPHAAWKTLVQDVQVCWHVLHVWRKQGSALTASVQSSTVQDNTCRTSPAQRRTPAPACTQQQQHAHEQHQSWFSNRWLHATVHE